MGLGEETGQETVVWKYFDMTKLFEFLGHKPTGNKSCISSLNWSVIILNQMPFKTECVDALVY